MAPKKATQSKASFCSSKKPQDYNFPPLSNKFLPLYYDLADFQEPQSSKNSKSSSKMEGCSRSSFEEPVPSDMEGICLTRPSSFYTFPTNPQGWYFQDLFFLQEKCRKLEEQLLLASQAPFSPLEKGENKPFTPLVNVEKLSEDEWSNFRLRMFFQKRKMLSFLQNEDVLRLIYKKARQSAKQKQVFISTYLQDFHHHQSAVLGLSVPGLTFVTEALYDDSKLCRLMDKPLHYQQKSNGKICNCTWNYTLSRVCLDLQFYQPISLQFNQERIILSPELLLDYGLVHQIVCSSPIQATRFGRKLAFSLQQAFKMKKKFAEAVIISKPPEWLKDGGLAPAQHIISVHFQNRRPTLMTFGTGPSDLCAKPIKRQIKLWRATVIARDFEAFPKGMGYLMAADDNQQIYCSKRIDPIPLSSFTQRTEVLKERRRDYGS